MAFYVCRMLLDNFYHHPTPKYPELFTLGTTSEIPGRFHQKILPVPVARLLIVYSLPRCRELFENLISIVDPRGRPPEWQAGSC